MARRPRELETREHDERPAVTFRPASLLPVPIMPAGVKAKWVRTKTLGNSDIINVSKKFREGWVPVKASEHPELDILTDLNPTEVNEKDTVEIGGLMLCQNSEEAVNARNDYYQQHAQSQLDSVEQQFLRENDPRMPLSRPERRSRTTIGNGGKRFRTDET